MEQMLENVPQKEVETKMVSVEKKCPPGHVERELNFRDRRLIILACLSHANGEDYKKLAKLDKVKKALLIDEVDDYFDMVNESLEIQTRAWTRETNIYRMYEALKSGGTTEKALLERFPGLDPKKAPEKPPYKDPELTPADERGKARPFYLRSALDVFIIEALKDMKWASADCEYVSELAAKYELPDEE